MNITHIKFGTKRTLIEWETEGDENSNDDYTQHRIVSPSIPHQDFLKTCAAIAPELRKLAGLEACMLTIKEIKFNLNDEISSVTCSACKTLEGGKVLTLGFPALEVKDGLVLKIQDIMDEAEMYASGQKSFNPTMDFEEQEEPQTTEKKKKGPRRKKPEAAEAV